MTVIESEALRTLLPAPHARTATASSIDGPYVSGIPPSSHTWANERNNKVVTDASRSVNPIVRRIILNSSATHPVMIRLNTESKNTQNVHSFNL